MSATLNAGQCGILTKSVTAPIRTRSIRLPAAPPSSSPVGSHTSGRSRWRDEEDEQRGQRGSAMTTSSAPPPENMLNATPVLRVWTNLIPRTSSTASQRSISPARSP